MTRVADALERVNPDYESVKPTPASFSTRKDLLEDPKPLAIATRTLERVPTAGGEMPLLAVPTGPSEVSAWRTDPELAGLLVGTEDFSSPASAQYRKLAATLHRMQGERGTRVIMVASAMLGEGKSLTSVNLALALSQSYHRRVLLIDADLRRPGIQGIFGLSAIDGLGDGLKAAHDRAMPVVQVADRLFVLPAGEPDNDPLRSLTSPRMSRLVQQGRTAFDWILIDTPPISLLPDATLLASCVDGVLLVVRPGQAPFHTVRRIIDSLGPDAVLGVVLNGVEASHGRAARDYDEYYRSGQSGASRAR